LRNIDPKEPDVPDVIPLDLKTTAADESAPSFIALSYCWGTPEFTKPIIIDGQAFMITPSL
jgi:hypothetical protein